MTGAARVLFIIAGIFWIVIGVLSALLVDRDVGPRMVMLSPSTDAKLFGAPAEQVLAENSAAFLVRYTLIRWMAGLLVGAGIVVTALAWYGLNPPQTWALSTLSIAVIAVIPYWWISLGQYRQAGIPIRLGDIPPFMWVPAILMTVSSILAWADQLSGVAMTP